MARKATPRYDVHPSVKMVQAWIRTLKTGTGRTLEQWMTLIEEKGPKQDAARRDWLKKEHGFGTNTASWMAARAAGKGWEDGDPRKYLKAAREYVEAMYEKRPDLRPIHDLLLEKGRALGDDVKVCPCKTIVPLYRKHVFAQIKPATKDRIDLGFALKHATRKPPKRLIDTGRLAKGDRITHKAEIRSAKDVDGTVLRWLAIAYDLDG